MLTAFSARSIVELKQRDKSKIESILAYGDKLLVGLNTGSLRIYRVNEQQEVTDYKGEDVQQEDFDGEEAPKAKPKSKPVDLLREEEQFSRKPIQQLAMIKEVGILVSLSDGYVSIHELQTYALQERLEGTKGATAFAITSNIVKDPTSGIPDIVSRLAVAVKRRILIWSWQAMELSEHVEEITLVAAVKSLHWATGTKMVVGMDPGFVMVNVETKEVEEIVKPATREEAGGQVGTRFGAVNSAGMGYMGMGGWVPKPMATKLGGGEILLARDVNTLFIDTEGKPLDKRQVPWAQAPETIGYSYPYLLALQPPVRGGLEVRSPDTMSLLQTISMPNAALLHVPQPNISLAHAGKGFLIASDRVVWRMGALDYESQIDVLSEQGRFDEAVSLLGMLEDTLLKDKHGRLREIKMQKAQSLFDARKYRDALDLFAEAEAPPARVIALYPKAIAGQLSRTKDPESDPEETLEAKTDEAKMPGSASPRVTAQGSIGRSMFSRLKAEQKKADSDTASVKSLKPGGGGNGSPKVKPADVVGEDGALEGKDLAKAVNELFPFLAQTRVKLYKEHINFDGTLKRDIPPVDERPKDFKPAFVKYLSITDDIGDVDWQRELFGVATLVDTTLFRAYMLQRPTLAGSLFRIDNFCDPLVVREKLGESGRYGELIDFLYGKKLHKEALEILARFGKKGDDEDVAGNLRGPQRTIGYLQQLPPELIDVILEFAEWPLRTSPHEGMQIFLADTENAETLPRHRVLAFLDKIDSNLAVQYLEHIIFELDDQTAAFHQTLIDKYLTRLKTNTPAFASPEERLDWRGRLERILKESTQYHRGRVFNALPASEPDFHESRALVLSKMGNHKQALQIYVLTLGDFKKAEDYCNEHYLASLQSPSALQPQTRPLSPPSSSTAPTMGSTSAQELDPEDDATGDKSIYHTLLSLYLSPPAPHTPLLSPALGLLTSHPSRLPASTTLPLLPASLPLAQLAAYFHGRLRTSTSVLAGERIESRLRAVEKARSQAALLARRTATVVVDEDRLCRVCGRRFGGSAVRVWPPTAPGADRPVTHYGCVWAAPGKSVARV